MMTMVLAVACNSQNAQKLKPTEFNDKIKNTANAVILDVRTPEEFDQGFIANAVNIDYRGDNFQSEIAKLDKSKTYFVYCLSGGRSASAASYMQSNGFKSVINLDGGILAWQGAGLPINTTTATPTTDKISMQDYTRMITSDTLVLVDFFAPWCAPCMKMKPMLEEISKEYAGKVKVVRLDISENKNLAQQLGITEIPLLKIFNNGNEIWTHQGYTEKPELLKVLK